VDRAQLARGPVRATPLACLKSRRPTQDKEQALRGAHTYFCGRTLGIKGVGVNGTGREHEEQLRIAMLYTWDWGHEFRDFERGLVPSHRLFGAADLRTRGASVAICRWGRAPKWLRRRQLWKVWQALWVMLVQRRFDCIIATTEAPSLPVLLLRRLRLVRVPVLVLAVAVLAEKYQRGALARLRRHLLREASLVIVYASAQVPLVAGLLSLPSERVRFVPFGVDVDFFQPATPREQHVWDVLSVGTNEGKDFPTLLAALTFGERCLIVTDALNREKILRCSTAGILKLDNDVPITRLRELYGSARRQVIPLRDVEVSSGQTVFLENLAMGRPVVVSDVSAIRDYVVPGVAIIVPPGDPAALRDALASKAPPHVQEAVEHVRRHFSSARFGSTLAALCTEIAGPRLIRE
jgi:glycosyltransferase involved in cell wall biosynthesis